MKKQKKQIYIVDDDASVRRALKTLLVTFGFQVETYSCSEDFLSAVPNAKEGCLILDIYMPGLDGWAALKRIVKSGSDRSIIIITADKNSELKDKSIKAGAAGFLQKPFKDQELIDLINHAY